MTEGIASHHKHCARISKAANQWRSTDRDGSLLPRLGAVEEKAFAAITSQFERTAEGVFVNSSNGAAIKGARGSAGSMGAICYQRDQSGEYLAVGYTGLIAGAYSWLIGRPIEGAVFSFPEDGFTPDDIDVVVWHFLAASAIGFHRFEDIEDLFMTKLERLVQEGAKLDPDLVGMKEFADEQALFMRKIVDDFGPKQPDGCFLNESRNVGIKPLAFSTGLRSTGAICFGWGGDGEVSGGGYSASLKVAYAWLAGDRIQRGLVILEDEGDISPEDLDVAALEYYISFMKERRSVGC